MAQAQSGNDQLNNNTASPVNAGSTDEWRNQPDRTNEGLSNANKPKISLGLAVAVVILLVILVAGFFLNKRNQERQTREAQPSAIPVSSPVPNVSPPVLPAVKEDSKKSLLGDYFKKASPNNYKESFLDNLPDEAANNYIKFNSGKDKQEKLDSARAFYIILNNPAVNRNDPEFLNFSADVRADLEKQLGGTLF